MTTTGDLAFDAPAVTIENALKTLLGRTDLTVSINGNVYELKFFDVAPGPFPTLLVGGTAMTTAHVGTLVPINPLDLDELHDRDHAGRGEEQDAHHHRGCSERHRTGC